LESKLEVFRGKKVLITGHTGFKGSWLAFTLSEFGAKVFGLSLGEPEIQYHSYYALGIKGIVVNSGSDLGDVRGKDLAEIISLVNPDFIFHLAAQAIVATSYFDPYLTFSTNTLGTLNLLETLRTTRSSATVIIITSDKCYKNFNSSRAYIEGDELGGIDPYSSSKAAAEIIFGSYLASYPNLCSENGIASARAGNVFGGGDWSKNRLIPNCVQDIFEGNPVSLRMPNATRPWTFVNDIINGYLELASALRAKPQLFRGSWNFASGEKLTVSEVVQIFINQIGQGKIEIQPQRNIGYESELLQIDPSKANKQLGWDCRYPIKSALSITAEWYKLQHIKGDMKAYSKQLLEKYYTN
jgi:CDP-glucose 4,6-dehydratase